MSGTCSLQLLCGRQLQRLEGEATGAFQVRAQWGLWNVRGALVWGFPVLVDMIGWRWRKEGLGEIAGFWFSQ